MTKGAERAKRVERGPGECLAALGSTGSGAPWKGDARLPGAAEETDVVGGQTLSGAWAGTAHCWIEGKTLLAVRPGTESPAQWMTGGVGWWQAMTEDWSQ